MTSVLIKGGIWSQRHTWRKDGRLKAKEKTSLVVQWIRICLPTQGTWVQSLVREDPTCGGARKLVHQKRSRACAPSTATDRTPHLLELEKV